jgi:hypothetical protein
MNLGDREGITSSVPSRVEPRNRTLLAVGGAPHGYQTSRDKAGGCVKVVLQP